ncbi:MAG: hypothetical protein CVV27_07910 [Candidatus Melainabacteria bacterium HGW-Melainabacteria-1]|nr:MAG: hypothetical protein CVV27_07910 [Candidatus Melainabacteria bacterium HGW-Melainabacteria-1]
MLTFSPLSQIIQADEHRYFKNVLKLLVRVTELHHPICQHLSYRIALMALQLGTDLKFNPERLRHLFYAALLHNLGRFDATHPFVFLSSSLQPLTAERVVTRLPSLQLSAAFIRWYAEHWDGSGYPDSLTGDQIPLESQIIGISRAIMLCWLQHNQNLNDALRAFDVDYHGCFQPELRQRLTQLVRDQPLWANDIEGGPDRFHALNLSLIDRALLGPTGSHDLVDVLRIFAQIIDAKHRYTLGHSLRVAALSKHLAELTGQIDVEAVEYAGLLHDVGKLGVPLSILDKPGRLEASEMDEIRHHPVLSDQLISTIPSLTTVALLARHHHERIDGKGYPDGLSGEEIPLGSRILALADTYDAMTSDRAYRKGLSHTEAIAEMSRAAGSSYDRDLVRLFMSLRIADIKELFASVKDVMMSTTLP